MTVLDASAVIALLRREPGADVVERALGDAVVSVANLAEVLAKAADRGLDLATTRELLDALGLVFEPVLDVDATWSAELRRDERRADTAGPRLSLGDRLCLATAHRLGRVVLTTDALMASVADGHVEVRLVR